MKHRFRMHGDTNRGAGKPFRGRGVDVPKSRRVNNRAVPCPTCGAEVQQPCVSAEGKPYVGTSHIARRRMALRKERGE